MKNQDASPLPGDLYEYTVDRSKKLGLIRNTYEPSELAKADQLVQMGLFRGIDLLALEKLEHLNTQNEILKSALKKLAMKRLKVASTRQQRRRPISSEKGKEVYPIVGRPMPWEEKLQKEERSRVVFE